MRSTIQLYLSTVLFIFLAACSKPRMVPDPITPTEQSPQIKVTTLAGVANSLYGRISPSQLATDRTGNLYIGDPYNNVICKLDPQHRLSLVAGSLGAVGNSDGKGTDARFNYQQDMVVDDKGNIFVSDYGNNRIRRIDPDGNVTTFAGNDNKAAVDGKGSQASFKQLNSTMAIDLQNNLYVVDNFTTVRKITPDGTVSTLPFQIPELTGLGVMRMAPSGHFYLTYPLKHQIFRLSLDGTMSLFAGSGQMGGTDGRGNQASFSGLLGLAIDPQGILYVSEHAGRRIRRIQPDGSTSTIAGSSAVGTEDGPGTSASFTTPRGIALDTQGNLYIADVDVFSVRKLDLNGMVSTVYGSQNTPISVGATLAQFASPWGLVSDSQDNIYIADRQNQLVRKLNGNGTVTIVAGSGKKGDINANGRNATFWDPRGIALDRNGNLYVADNNNQQLRKIEPSGTVSTIERQVFSPPFTLDFKGTSAVALDSNGVLFYASTYTGRVYKFAGGYFQHFSQGISYHEVDAVPFSGLQGIAIDKNGNVYVADTENSRIYKINKDGVGGALAGGFKYRHVPNVGSQDGFGAAASFNHPHGITVDRLGFVYVADTENHLIRKISAAGEVTTIAGLKRPGHLDGDQHTATFNRPVGITLNAKQDALFVTDAGSGLIRKIALR